MAAAPAEASAIAAEAAALADVAIPAIPAPDDAAMLDGTPVGRKAIGARPTAGRNGKAERAPATGGGGAAPGAARDDDGRPTSRLPRRGRGGGTVSGVLPMQMVGDGPLIVREKFHASQPMTIDEALLEMELVGHDFFAYHDSECGKFSVVYRRRGYDYGVIRLVERLAEHCKPDLEARLSATRLGVALSGRYA